MKTIFQPSPGFILIKVTDEQASELDIVNDPEKTPASQGIVVAVGGAKLSESGIYVECPVEVGNLIVFKPYGIIEMMLDNTAHRIIDFDNVRGVLKNENK